MVTSSLQQFGFAIIVFFPVLAFLIVCLRVYSRTSTGQFGWDDGLIVIAMAMSIGETYVTWMFMQANFVGIHYKDIPLDVDPTPGLIWNFAVQVLYNPILAIVKISSLLFILRLTGTKKAIRHAIFALIAFTAALMLAIFIVVIFQCHPLAFNWDHTIEGGTCIQQGAFYVATTVLTLITDILVLALPFWIVMGLKMARRTKIAIIGIFLLGFIVTIVGVIRMVAIIQAFFYAPPADPTYNIGFTTSAIETNIAIITASMPAMKPLFKRWFPRLFSTLSNANRYEDGPYSNGSRYARNTIKSGNGTGRSKSGMGGMGGMRSGHGGFEMKSMRNERGVEIKSQNEGSQEAIMTFDGIVKTTDLEVRYAHRPTTKDEEQGLGGFSRHAKSRVSDYGMRTSVESL